MSLASPTATDLLARDGGVGSLSVQHLSFLLSGCPSLGCHLAWLVCVALLSRDSGESVEDSALRRLPSLNFQHLSLGLGEDEERRGASTWPTPSHRHPGLPDTWRFALGPTGMRLCSIHTPGPTVWEQPGGAGWGATSVMGLGRGEGERGTSSLLSESGLTRRPAATHPHTCACTYMTQCL